MGGLGPNNSSLLERTGKAFELTEDWLVMDRQERSQVRKLAVIKWRMKKQKAQKPVAPVEETSQKETKDGVRLWIWKGEDNGLKQGELYTSDDIRRYGFKLPKLKKKGKIK